MKPLVLCIVATHPIQYIAPWFRKLANTSGLKLEVIYFRELDAAAQGVGFGRSFSWDVPLREGYSSQVLAVSAGTYHLPRLLFRLSSALTEIRPDVVLLTGWNEVGLAAASPLVKLLGFPIVMRGESNSLRVRNLVTRAIHRLLLSCSSAAVVIGASNRDFYLQSGLDADQLYPGAYFVESDRLVAMSVKYGTCRAELRRSAGFSEEDFVFAFVGKHVPFKRPELLLDAARVARDRGKNVKLLFAGSGELTQRLRERAALLGIPVHFTGFLNQSELWRAYIPADAFVLPSTNRETWGLVTNEAMIFGLPAIVSDQVGCGPDLVVDGQTGYIFTGEALGLAEKMIAIASDPERAKIMGAQAKARVLSKYSMDIATDGLLSAVKSVHTAEL